MGNLTSMFSSNSKANSTAKIIDSSTSSHHIDQSISTRTSKEQRALQMSRHTWRKTESSLIMEFSKSTADLLEEVSNLPTTRMPRSSMQDPSWRPSIY
nr:AC4 protein [Begomovirus caboniensis]UWJ07372.1 AC4 protein [Begomovirus caboniensis]